MYQRSRLSWLKHIDFMIIDIICIFISYYIAFEIRFNSSSANIIAYRKLLFIMLVMEFVASVMTSNLSDVLKRGYMVELYRVIALCAVILTLVSIYIYASDESGLYSRIVVYGTLGIFILIDYLFRILWKSIIVHRLKTGKISASNERAILILTDKENAIKIINDIRKDFLNKFIIKGIAFTDFSSDLKEIEGINIVGNDKDAPAYICREWVDEVFIYLPGNATDISEFVDSCMEMGITVHTVMDLSNIDEKKQYVESLGGKTVLTTAFNYISPAEATVKRIIDIVGGLIGTIITVIVAIIIGPIIIISSPGPIIFKQTRIGKNGRQFKVLKFRSMYLDAEDRKKELLDQNRVSDGMMFKMEFDPRIIGNKVLPDGSKKTGIGEFIRKTSLDEFPQFINVLKGDMSLVGTRPPTVDEWEKYENHHRARMAMRPGITGMWQVSGRSNITDFEEVVKLDTYYITNWSLSMDIKILIKTILVVFKHEGSL